MLPDTIYRMLPYIYIVVGVLCAMLVESELVYVSSVVLVFTGLLVLWMRYAGGAHYEQEKHASGPSLVAEFDLRPRIKKERRQTDIQREFPLINNKGEIIALDRRLGSA